MRSDLCYKGAFCAFVLAVALFFTTSANSQSWNSLGTGTNGVINASIVYNGQLIVAGQFTTAGGVTVNNIAAWNGTAWSALGAGTDSAIYSLIIFQNQLVAAGRFTMAGGNACNRIARWNGTTWSNLGLGTNNSIFATAVFQNNLRVGGTFTTAGGIAANRLATWNGTTWTAFNGTGANDTVFAMVQFGNNLVLGGKFTNVSGTTANRVVSFSGFNYTALGSGLDNGACYALASYNNNLYVGGSYTTIGGVTVNNLARWSGTNWNTVGSGTNGPVKSFSVNNNNLIVGGSFTGIGNSIASWNGTSFSTLGNGITGGSPSVNTSTTWSNILIAGGSFTTAGLGPDVAASNVAAYGSAPAAPTLLSPPNASVGISLTPILDWSDVTGATTYGVQVSLNPNFTSTVINLSLLPVSVDTVATGILQNSTTYFWRANATNGLGTSAYSAIWFFTTSILGIINNQEIPLQFALHQNYPNPFNPTTKIKFDLPSGMSGKLNLDIYNVSGQLVKNILSTDYAAGKWEVDFDASNLPSGAYFCKITAGDFTAVNKMVLVK